MSPQEGHLRWTGVSFVLQFVQRDSGGVHRAHQGPGEGLCTALTAGQEASILSPLLVTYIMPYYIYNIEPNGMTNDGLWMKTLPVPAFSLLYVYMPI